MSSEPPEDLDLLQDVDAALEGHPLDLLAQVSGLLTVLDSRSRDPFHPPAEEPPSLEELVSSFLDVDLRQTTALLHGFAALTDNDLLAARIRKELTGRHHELPPWLSTLPQVEVYRTMEMRHVLRDGDNLILGVRLPTGEELTAMVYVDHNVGTLVKDAFAIPDSINVVHAMYVEASDNDPDTTYSDIDPAEARAKITDAIATAAMTYPPFESDSWPMSRALVEWLVRQLPGGGRGYEPAEWSDADRRRLAADFFSSPFSAELGDEDRRLLESVLWFGCEYAGGDPLRWSGVRVEVFADWLGRKVRMDPATLEGIPDVLAAFVGYSHAQRGIRPHLTEETLAAIDVHLGGQVAELSTDDAVVWNEWNLQSLAREVGSHRVLMDLDGGALPDEAFDWSGIADDIRPAVGEVLALVDAACEELFDIEVRTACRRLLRRAALGGPMAFRRRSKAQNTAGAICWIVGSGNDLFTVHGRQPVLVKDLLAFLGIKGSVSQRADTLMRVAGIEPEAHGPVVLGSPELLTSSFRRELIRRRDA